MKTDILNNLLAELIFFVVMLICLPLLKKFGKFIVNEYSKRNKLFRDKIYKKASYMNKNELAYFNSRYIYIFFFMLGGMGFAYIILASNNLVDKSDAINTESNYFNSVFQVRIIEIVSILYILFFLFQLFLSFVNSFTINDLINEFEHRMRLLKLSYEQKIEFEYQWAKMKTKEDYDNIMKQFDELQKELNKELAKNIFKL